jgi:phage gpG-like protein
MSQVIWHGDAALDHVRGRAVSWLRRAAIAVRRRAAELLSVPGTAARVRGTKRHRKGSRITGAVRSLPGEPPRKQTGRLRASVTYEVDEQALTARVGTNVKYGRYLELGTRRGIAPRPWLRRALAECQSRIMGFLNQIEANE